MSQRQLLVLGNLKGAAMAALDVARRDTGFDALIHPKADDAIAALDAGEYRAMLVDLTTPGAARFCHEARARRVLFNVPLIALSPKLTDLAFSNALRWGADDVVELGATDPLSARLSALPRQVAPIIDPTRGEAVIADPERSRCDVLGRVLANAGFNVKYATDAVTTRFYLAKPSVSLFVLNTELGDPVSLISDARGQKSQADWVVTTKTLDVDGVRTKLKGLKNVMVMSSHGPPENVLFALNLLRPASETQRRAEVRALYGAIVLFRPVGLDRDEFGFSYSVSPRGLYLRTLLEPPSERLWMEMTPPNVPRRVKLLAEVAWSRTFGEAGAGTAPAGFGVRILDGLGDDLDLWQQGFNSLDIKVPAGGVPEVSTSTSSSFRVPLPSGPPGRGSRAPSGSVAPKRTSRLPPLRSSSNIGRISTLPRLSTTPSLRPKQTPVAVSKPPGAVTKTPVVVPPATWNRNEEPRPAPGASAGSATSQDAVMRAIRASLPPGSIAALPAGASKLPPPTKVGASTSAEPERVASLPAPPTSANPTEPPASSTSSAPRSSTVDLDTGAVIDFDDDIPARPSTQLPDSQLRPPPVEAANARSTSDASAEAEAPAAVPAGRDRASDERRDESDEAHTPERKQTGTVLGIGQLSHFPTSENLPGTVKIEDAPAPPISLSELDSPEPSEVKTAPKASAPADDAARAAAATREAAPGARPDDGNGSATRDRDTLGADDAGPAEADARGEVADAPSPARVTPPLPPSANQVPPPPALADLAVEKPTPLADKDLISLPPAVDEPTNGGVELGETKPPPLKRDRPSRVEARPPPPESGSSLARSGLIAAAITVVALVVGLQVYERVKPKSHEASRPAVQTPTATASPMEPAATGKAEAVPTGAPEALASPPSTPSPPTDPNEPTEQAAADAQQNMRDAEQAAAGSGTPRDETPNEAAKDQPAHDEDGDTQDGDAEDGDAEDGDAEDGDAEDGDAEDGDDAEDSRPAGQSAPPSPDVKLLPKDQAYLYVHSKLDARVFVHGVDLGKTNQWLQSHCGFRFIRLGEAPGKWLSDGRPSKLRCRRANQLELQPAE